MFSLSLSLFIYLVPSVSERDSKGISMCIKLSGIFYCFRKISEINRLKPRPTISSVGVASRARRRPRSGALGRRRLPRAAAATWPRRLDVRVVVSSRRAITRLIRAIRVHIKNTEDPGGSDHLSRSRLIPTVDAAGTGQRTSTPRRQAASVRTTDLSASQQHGGGKWLRELVRIITIPLIFFAVSLPPLRGG